MTAKESVDDDAIAASMKIWQKARLDAIESAWALHKQGVHKQVVNRLLEPFSTITVICSGTEYQNFFDQRCHPDAQPEIKALADKMREAYDASIPERLSDGEWHMPFAPIVDSKKLSIEETLKIATGRCARVSYLNHDGNRDIMADIALHDKLLSSKPAHLSPFEHCAMALDKSEKHGNFTGFKQYRKFVEGKQNI